MWHGTMNWPIEADWKCEVCGNKPLMIPCGPEGHAVISHGLTWGLAHGSCRCNECHAQYRMCDVAYNRLTTPALAYDAYWAAVARAGWNEFHAPLDEWTKAIHDWAMGVATGGEVKS